MLLFGRERPIALGAVDDKLILILVLDQGISSHHKHASHRPIFVTRKLVQAHIIIRSGRVIIIKYRDVRRDLLSESSGYIFVHSSDCLRPDMERT